MQIVIIILAAGLLAVLGWAGSHGGGGEALAWLTGNPWGIATLTDLYLSFTLFGVFVWRLERSAAKALLWLVPTFVLGSVVPALYLVLKLARIPSFERSGQ